MTFLYIFRDNPSRELKIDVEWAVTRFKRKFNEDASLLLVNPSEEKEFQDLGLKVEIDSKIGKGYFGVA